MSKPEWVGGLLMQPGQLLPWCDMDPVVIRDTQITDTITPEGELVLPRRLQHEFINWLKCAGHRYELSMRSANRMDMRIEAFLTSGRIGYGGGYGGGYRLYFTPSIDCWKGSQEILEAFYDSLEQAGVTQQPLNDEDNHEGNQTMSEMNSAAFLRNDTKTVHVQYLGEGATSKTYTYITHLNLAEGDKVIVPVRSDDTLALATVVKVDDDLTIEPRANQKYRWVAMKADLTDYQAQMEKNAQIETTVRDSYRLNARRSFQLSMLEGLPEDKKAELTALLGK